MGKTKEDKRGAFYFVLDCIIGEKRGKSGIEKIGRHVHSMSCQERRPPRKTSVRTRLGATSHAKTSKPFGDGCPEKAGQQPETCFSRSVIEEELFARQHAPVQILERLAAEGARLSTASRFTGDLARRRFSG
jgi:hypothetical protein